jgi:hypothetical protein
MFRLAFIVAVVFALFGGQSGNTAIASTSQEHDFPAFLTSQQDVDPSETGGCGEAAVEDPEIEMDDEAAVRQEERTTGCGTVRPEVSVPGFVVGPSQSHARPMERPPRV